MVYLCKQWTLLKTLTGIEIIFIPFVHVTCRRVSYAFNIMDCLFNIVERLLVSFKVDSLILTSTLYIVYQHDSNSLDHSGVATGVRFGQNASFLASAGMDCSLKYYRVKLQGTMNSHPDAQHIEYIRFIPDVHYICICCSAFLSICTNIDSWLIPSVTGGFSNA